MQALFNGSERSVGATAMCPEPSAAHSPPAVAARATDPFAANEGPEPAAAAATARPLRRSHRQARPDLATAPARDGATLPGAVPASGRKRPPSSAVGRRPSPRSLKQPRSDGPSATKRRGNLKEDADHHEDTKPPARPDGFLECCICMSDPDAHQRSTVNGCDHQFCFDCIAEWSNRENSCPLCKARFTKIVRCLPAPRPARGEPKAPNSKTVRRRDQRSDMFGSGFALQHLLANIAASARGGTSAEEFLTIHRAGGFVIESRISGIESLFAFTHGDRGQGFFGGLESDDDDDDDSESDFFGFEMLPRFEIATGAGPPRVRAMARARASSPGRRGRPGPSIGPAAAAAAGRAARMSAPSMIRVERAAAPGAPAVPPDGAGASAAQPLEVDDSSTDDEVQVVEVVLD